MECYPLKPCQPHLTRLMEVEATSHTCQWPNIITRYITSMFPNIQTPSQGPKGSPRVMKTTFHSWESTCVGRIHEQNIFLHVPLSPGNVWHSFEKTAKAKAFGFLNFSRTLASIHVSHKTLESHFPKANFYELGVWESWVSASADSVYWISASRSFSPKCHSFWSFNSLIWVLFMKHSVWFFQAQTSDSAPSTSKKDHGVQTPTPWNWSFQR